MQCAMCLIHADERVENGYDISQTAETIIPFNRIRACIFSSVSPD